MFDDFVIVWETDEFTLIERGDALYLLHDGFCFSDSGVEITRDKALALLDALFRHLGLRRV